METLKILFTVAISLYWQLMNSNERNKQALQEISQKEEDLVLVKVELTTLKEKLSVKSEEVRCMIIIFSWYHILYRVGL